MRLDRDRVARWLPHLFLFLVLLLTSLVRLRLLATPFERDEGEYALAGQLILKGIPPYSQLYNMKFPGTYLAFAAVEAVFGQTTAGVHTGLLVVNLASALVVALIGRRCFNETVGALAGAFYAILSLGPGVQGTSAHATQFLVLPAVLGVYFLLRTADSGRARDACAAGAFFGAAVLMKQHAAVFPAFALLILGLRARRAGSDRLGTFLREAGCLCAGAAAVLGLAGLWLWASGVWRSFWFWTFTYARAYVSITSPAEGLRHFTENFSRVLASSPAVWLLAALGLVGAASKEGRGGRWLLAFAGFSALGVCPGFYFRPHYFVAALPAAALLAAWGAALLARAPVRGAPARGESAALLGVGLLAVGVSLVSRLDYYFTLSPVEVCRAVYGLEPFPETRTIGGILRRQGGAAKPIFVLGSEPEVYFYSRRPTASGYIYLYSLQEEQPYAEVMAAQMIREVEAAKPEYVVVESVPRRIEDWAEEFLRGYELALRADVVSNDRTYYVTGRDLLKPTPGTQRNVLVYKRAGS